EALTEVMTQLVSGLGSEQERQRAADHRAESKGADHREGGLVGIALLQADPGEQVIAFRESGPKLLGKVLESHRSSSIVGLRHEGRRTGSPRPSHARRPP